MASDWVLCAGPLVIKAIREFNVHCAHLAARLPDESSRDAPHFQLFGNLDPTSKVSMSTTNLHDTQWPNLRQGCYGPSRKHA